MRTTRHLAPLLRLRLPPGSPWDLADDKSLKDQESRLCRFLSGLFDKEVEPGFTQQEAGSPH
jgi:hypothetical protein